jgi:hypothetical protein
LATPRQGAHFFIRFNSWDRCYDFLNFFAEKFSEKIGVFDPKQSYWVLRKKHQFFRRKLSKFAENCDHNIDPWPKISAPGETPEIAEEMAARDALRRHFRFDDTSRCPFLSACFGGGGVTF